MVSFYWLKKLWSTMGSIDEAYYWFHLWIYNIILGYNWTFPVSAMTVYLNEGPSRKPFQELFRIWDWYVPVRWFIHVWSQNKAYSNSYFLYSHLHKILLHLDIDVCCMRDAMFFSECEIMWRLLYKNPVVYNFSQCGDVNHWVLILFGFSI